MILDQWGNEIGGRPARPAITAPTNPRIISSRSLPICKRGKLTGRRRWGTIADSRDNADVAHLHGDRTYTADANMFVSDGVIPITANGWATYGGSQSIIDFGGNQGQTVSLPSIAVNATYTPQQARIDAVLFIALTQIAVGTNVYTFIIVGSNSPTFSSAAYLGAMQLGTGASLLGYSAGGAAFGNTPVLVQGNSPTQVYEIPFTNEQNSVKYEFMGLWMNISGSTPSLTFKSFVAVLPED